MQIVFQTADGATVPIAATIWRPLAETMETVAMRGGRAGRGPQWVEAAVLSWCRPTHRPPVDDASLADGVLILSVFDTVAGERDAEAIA